MVAGAGRRPRSRCLRARSGRPRFPGPAQPDRSAGPVPDRGRRRVRLPRCGAGWASSRPGAPALCSLSCWSRWISAAQMQRPDGAVRPRRSARGAGWSSSSRATATTARALPGRAKIARDLGRPVGVCGEIDVLSTNYRVKRRRVGGSGSWSRRGLGAVLRPAPLSIFVVRCVSGPKGCGWTASPDGEIEGARRWPGRRQRSLSRGRQCGGAREARGARDRAHGVREPARVRRHARDLRPPALRADRHRRRLRRAGGGGALLRGDAHRVPRPAQRADRDPPRRRRGHRRGQPRGTHLGTFRGLPRPGRKFEMRFWRCSSSRRTGSCASASTSTPARSCASSASPTTRSRSRAGWRRCSTTR